MNPLLPDSYLRFSTHLREVTGAETTAWFGDVGFFVPRSTDLLQSWIIQLARRRWTGMHPDLVPFAADGAGNLFCFVLSAATPMRDSQAVVLWMYETYRCVPVASSFDLFVAWIGLTSFAAVRRGNIAILDAAAYDLRILPLLERFDLATDFHVLLPLTGKFAQPAASLRAAIEQAAATLDGAYTVSVYDTAGVATQCVTVLQKAVIEDGATIVIGPLTKEEAATCAPAAQALHVAMLPLTSSADVLTAGDQVFRPYPTSEDQVRALVAETLGRRSMKLYAILHPQTVYGENAAKAFVNEVTAGGGSVTVDVGYDPTTADFRSVAKQLAGKTFEAIFIPDTYQTVALIASAVAFQEISVGGFQTAKGPPAVPLLGLNAWHNDEIARRGGAYVQHGIFVDAFDARAPEAAVAKFVADWKGETPPSVVDAIGYDAMLLAAAALAAGGDPAEALTTVEITDCVAGTLGFSASREARRNWRLLTVTRTGIEPLATLVVQPPDPQ